MNPSILVYWAGIGQSWEWYYKLCSRVWKVSLIRSFYILMFTKNRIYYQFKSNCLSACPLTAHALLHILNDIWNNGPPCMNWMFVMECWCGSLLPAIKLWKKPFICLAFQQYQAVQYLEITNWYNLLDLVLTIINDNLPLQHEKLFWLSEGMCICLMCFNSVLIFPKTLLYSQGIQ